MERIFIASQNGQKTTVQVVRYFKTNGISFFIYTLQEKDENQYIKLYVTKINETSMQSQNIIDEAEWNMFKTVMTNIIKNNQVGQPVGVEDLNTTILNNIVIYDARTFKLNEQVVSLLSENRDGVVPATTPLEPVMSITTPVEEVLTVPGPLPEIAIPQPVAITTEPIPVAVPTSVMEPTPDYRTMYETLQQENDRLKQEVDSYKQKLDQIKGLVN